MVRLILLVALTTAAAQTYYLFDKQKGLATVLEPIFGGMEIENGILNPKREVPFIPANYLFLPVLDQLSGISTLFDTLPQSFVVVDTTYVKTAVSNEKNIVLSKSSIFVRPGKGAGFEIPYSVVFVNGNFKFTITEIQRYLQQNVAGLVIHFAIWNGVVFTSILLLTVFFLSFAAYVFRINGGWSLWHYMRIAVFATTPVAIGTILSAIAGVKVPWVWHLLVFFSTILMFRAILITSIQTESTPVE